MHQGRFAKRRYNPRGDVRDANVAEGAHVHAIIFRGTAPPRSQENRAVRWPTKKSRHRASTRHEVSPYPEQTMFDRRLTGDAD